jgi:hypothetical protein
LPPPSACADIVAWQADFAGLYTLEKDPVRGSVLFRLGSKQFSVEELLVSPSSTSSVFRIDADTLVVLRCTRVRHR